MQQSPVHVLAGALAGYCNREKQGGVPKGSLMIPRQGSCVLNGMTTRSHCSRATCDLSRDYGFCMPSYHKSTALTHNDTRGDHVCLGSVSPSCEY